METALSVLARRSFGSRGDDMLLKVWRRLRRRPRKAVRSRDYIADEQRADARLHDLATRLHVLEWEVYGFRKTPRGDHE